MTLRNTDITPGRSTTLTLDLTETVVVEAGINIMRQGADVASRAAQSAANDSEWKGLKFWGSGCWTIRPLQQDLANLYETNAGQNLIVNNWNFVQAAIPGGGTQDMLQPTNNQNRSTVAGASYSSNVPAFGDPFLHKSISAVASFNPGSLSVNSGFDSARPVISYEYTDVPMDRVAVSQSTYPTNQGFFIRWRAPGVLKTYPRYIWAFYFGQYGLVLGGSGLAELWEYCHSSAGVLRWVRRDRWRFAQQAAAPGTAHAMGIFPHQAPTGERYIAFSLLSSGASSRTDTNQRGTATDHVIEERLYKFDIARRNGDIDESPGTVTTSDYIRFDMRRDLRPEVQVSLLAGPANTSYTLLDDCTICGGYSWTGNTNPLTITLNAYVPTGTTLTAVVQNPDTGTAFVPGTTIFAGAKFTFHSDSQGNSPILWGYTVTQAPLTTTAAPGQFSMAGRSYHIEGYSGDPSSESATVNAADPTSQHTRLTKRGEFSALLTTTYTPPGGSAKTVSLFRGYAIEPRSVRRGVDDGRHGTYPAGDWREYTMQMQGMWYRLAERVEPAVMRTYLLDLTTAATTWKVTDILQDLLQRAGFVSSQINIPDLPYRIWPGYSNKSSDYQINPGGSFAEMAVRLCREYLGCYLCFEPNSGAAGQWILIFGTQMGTGGTFTPLWNFTQTPNTYPKTYHPAAFPTNTTFYTTGDEIKPRRPDFNAIVVTSGISMTTADTQGQVTAFAANPLSYAVPGMTTPPNPDHPDYLGRLRLGVFIAPQLATDDYALTMQAVQWTCRRYYDFLCHGQRLRHIHAPLIFVYDTSLSATAASSSGNYRPLRFQDPVSIDGDNSWLIKNVTPTWNYDGTQMADYELIQPAAGQFFYGMDGKEEERRQFKRMAHRASGLATHTALHSLYAPSAHREQAHLELPYIRHGFSPLQNADGSFIPMADWYTQTGTSG
jgi:hypothetical protein